ncbi:MAG: hypothetical protein EOM20_13160 [Spartobacteria bacterium]|nr:hypothetical protein [Spartobacteria bacterium]
MKYLILFEDEYPGLAEHSAPLVNACLESGRFEVAVASRRENLPALKAAYAPFAPVDRIEVVAYEDWTPGRDWRAMVSTVPGSPGPVIKHLDGPVRIPRVGLTHGLTDKINKFPAHFPGHPLGYFNVMFASGPAMFTGSWEQYLARHPETASGLKVMPVGAPKTDLLLAGSFDRAAYLQALGLPPAQPTVLYAPTYQQEASLEECGLEIIEALARMEVNVLIKLHHCSLQSPAVHPHAGERYWTDIINEIVDVFPHVRLIHGEGIPAFRAADLMIGDASGASFEFILQNKPVIFIDVPRFFAVHGEAGIGYRGRCTGPVISNLEALQETIRQELEYPGHYEAQRLRLADELAYNRGHALEAAVTALLDLIEGRETYPAWGPEMNRRYDIMLRSHMMARLQRVAVESVVTALFGAGAHTRYLLDLMDAATSEGYIMPQPACILDDNATPRQQLRGLDVITPEAARDRDIDSVILSTDYFQEPMRKRCHAVLGATINTIDLYEKFPWHRLRSTP